MSPHVRSLLLALPLFACGARTDVADFLTSDGSLTSSGGGPAPIGGSGGFADGGGAVGGGTVLGSGGAGGGSVLGSGGVGGGEVVTATFDDSRTVNALDENLETLASESTRILGLALLQPVWLEPPAEPPTTPPRLRADIYTLPNQSEFVDLTALNLPISPILLRKAPSEDRYYVVVTSAGWSGLGPQVDAWAFDANMQQVWSRANWDPWMQVVDAAVRADGQLLALGLMGPDAPIPALFEWALDGSSVTPVPIADHVPTVDSDAQIGTDNAGTVHILADGPYSLARRTTLGDWLPPADNAPNLISCYQCSYLAVSPSGSGYIVAQTWDGYPAMYRYNPDGFMTLLGALDTTDQVVKVLPDGENLVVISRGNASADEPFTVREWTPHGTLVRHVVLNAVASISLKVATIAPNGRIDLLLHDEVGQFGSPSDLMVSTPAY